MKVKYNFSDSVKQKLKIVIAENNEKSFFIKCNTLDKNIISFSFLSLYKKNKIEDIKEIINNGDFLVRVCKRGRSFPNDEEINFLKKIEDKVRIIYALTDFNLDNINLILDNSFQTINIDDYFRENGILSKKLKNFEYRQEQYDMAKTVEESLNDDIKSIIEAGTGTGKTIGYLLPSILWAIENKQKVVIATNTINLQEQILFKDLPMLKEVMDIDFSYSLIKGRNNYMCNRLFHENILNGGISLENYTNEQKEQVHHINYWGVRTETGDKSELPFEVSYEVWENIQSSTEFCIGKSCKHREDCFFFKARKEKFESDIIISNHHIFFADLNLRSEVDFDSDYLILPKYRTLIFDEAHNIESVARNYFSFEISRLSFIRLLNRIYNESKNRRKQKSVITRIQNEFKNNEISQDEEYNDLINLIKYSYGNIVSLANIYFDSLKHIVDNGEESEIKKTVTAFDMLKSEFFSEVREKKNEFLKALDEFYKSLKDLHKLISVENKNNIELINFSNHINMIKNFINTFNQIHLFNEEDYVYWITVNSKKTNVSLTAAPLDISSNMIESLFSKLNRIIFTSATLSVNDDFSYFKNSIGLTDEKCLEAMISSPFNYEKQMKVFIPCDIGNNQNSFDYIKDISNFIEKLLVKLGGRTFILFTSYSLLNQVYYNVSNKLRSHGIEVLLHGSMPRSRIVEKFKIMNKPVLFATSSFWEGVDVQGENLSTVIIVKLPFLVPTDPIVHAKSIKLEENGKNSFFEYQIPEAVIKFKQGIGRLIRKKDDTGNIVILDNRIINKEYGKFFIKSIPVSNINKISKKEIIDCIY